MQCLNRVIQVPITVAFFRYGKLGGFRDALEAALLHLLFYSRPCGKENSYP